MNWNYLTQENEVNFLNELSASKPILIFKHSTRCSISATALNRFEKNWQDGNLQPYFLDLISHRNVSDLIAKQYQVKHESPQILVILNGQCVYHASHFDIDFNELKQFSYLPE